MPRPTGATEPVVRRLRPPAGAQAGSAPEEQPLTEVAGREALAVFETAFAQAPIGMALVGLDGRWTKVNAAICKITGWSEEDLLQRTFQDITHPDDLDADLAQIELLLTGQIDGYQMEKRYVTRLGEQIWVLLSVSLVRDAAGSARHFISQIEDISQRKEDERRMRAADAEARRQRDHATAIVGAMHEGYELVGSRTPFPFSPPERLRENTAIRDRVLKHRGGSYEVTLMRKNGERFEAEITAQPAVDADGEALGFVNTMRDVSVALRQQRELERLARTDHLTGLANRRVLEDALQRNAALARRHGRTLALVLLDLDWFKRVNDHHGHPAGDAVLIEVARRLQRITRDGELLARVGGEEFAWLVTEATADQAIGAADRARLAISSLPFVGAGQLTLSAGVGLIEAPTDGDALYRLADRALYEAKQEGRNRTCCRVSPVAGVSRG